MRQSGWIALAVIAVIAVMAIMSQVDPLAVDWYDDGTLIAQRSGLNAVSGDGLVVTSTDTPANTRVDITFSSAFNSGAATIAASATSTDVTHSLTASPTRVIISPTTNYGARRFWVSAKSSTVFRIELDAAHTDAINFDWRAGPEE